MLVEILTPVARLVIATMVGFALFKIKPVARHLTKPFVFVIVNIVFPLYFVHSLPQQWADGLAAGWEWMAVFFLAFIVFMTLQLGLAKLLVNRVRLLKTRHPEELIVLFAMHNAGYIPIPIIAALAPPAVSVYMSFYMMAFVLSFFTVAVWLIQSAAGIRSDAQAGAPDVAGSPAETTSPRESASPARARPQFKLNAPVVGIVLGLVLASTGLYNRFPDWVQAPFRWASFIALDAIMVVLGAILAGIPRERLAYRREYGGLVLIKMVLFPAAVLGLMALVPLPGLDPEVASGIRLAMVIEAAVPPATNIMVITKAYGTEEQVDYAGGAIVTTYLAALVLIPLFLVLSRLLFG